jgi:hypothetical protein
MDHQDDCQSLFAHGDRPLSLCARELSDGTPSPGATSWLTDTSVFSRRASSRSPSLYSVPSVCSTQEFPPTPPPNSALRLPQVPVVPSIRHRTPLACDKCRERKTKVSFFACMTTGIKHNHSAPDIVPFVSVARVADFPVHIPHVRHEYGVL